MLLPMVPADHLCMKMDRILYRDYVFPRRIVPVHREEYLSGLRSLQEIWGEEKSKAAAQHL